jgi:hypothetical protein
MSKNNVNDDAMFSEAGKVQFGYVTFEKPGDRVKGVYVGKYSSVSAKYGYEQMNYVLVKEDGEKVIVSGRNATKTNPVRIIFGMEKIPFGAVMGFIYTGDKDTGKGNPAKLIEPRYMGEKDMATYEKFTQMYNLGEVAQVADNQDSSDEAVTPSDEF